MLELPDDPYDGISASAAAVIDNYLMPDDFDVSADQLEAMEILCAELWELMDEDADAQKWLGDLATTGWSVVRDSDGAMRASGDESEAVARICVPPEVIAVLAAIVGIADSDDRYIALDSLDTIMRETLAVCIDDEKMLGHLLLAHRVPFPEIAESDDDRFLQHAALHSAGRRHRPGN